MIFSIILDDHNYLLFKNKSKRINWYEGDIIFRKHQLSIIYFFKKINYYNYIHKKEDIYADTWIYYFFDEFKFKEFLLRSGGPCPIGSSKIVDEP